MAHSVKTKEQCDWENWHANRDRDAGERLLLLYMPLVNYHVHRISVGLPRGVDIEELKSHGMIGLYDALDKFDAKRDLKFDTYASFRIRGAILDGLRKEDWVPRSLREKARKIDAATEKLQQQYLRPATTIEVAEEVGLTEEEVASVQSESFLANVLSIDDDVRRSGEGQQYFSLEDKKAAVPEAELVKDETVRDLAEIIETLNENEKLVVSLFYYEELTLTEIGKVLGLSTSRISQIHSKALFRLKQALLDRNDGFLDAYGGG
ncbi:MAG TPA: FliA/WhiG family RNA polymerase sigma factor [Bacillales bacterium]|nr:FliA/WhiG family RNA polymerase sigma factor [Bacillales bacterium]